MKADSSFHNHTGPQDMWYALTGIPGREHLHTWIAIPICSVYIVAVLGNVLLIFLIVTERSLHEPMHFFLSMLALADLLLSTAYSPQDAGRLLGSFQEYILWELCLPNVLHSFRLCGRVCYSSGHGI